MTLRLKNYRNVCYGRSEIGVHYTEVHVLSIEIHIESKVDFLFKIWLPTINTCSMLNNKIHPTLKSISIVHEKCMLNVRMDFVSTCKVGL